MNAEKPHSIPCDPVTTRSEQARAVADNTAKEQLAASFGNDTRPREGLCGAKTRSGHPCRSHGMPNGRCRMHGGTNPGAPRGNRNAWKHGLRSAEHQAHRQLLRAMVAQLDAVF